MSPSKIIFDLSLNSSRLAKEVILQQAYDSPIADEFFMGCKLALDPLLTFGVGTKMVPTKKELSETTDTLTNNEFRQLLDQLATRTLTGNAAIDAIRSAMDKSSTMDWNYWYRRILLKNLDCGVSDKTINKIVGHDQLYQIPVFACQLAEDSAKAADHHLTGIKQIESKMDGVRCLAILQESGQVLLFSRNGKELTNFPLIKAELEAAIQKNDSYKGWVLDGEIMSASFQDLMKQVYRKQEVNTDESILNIFDKIPLSDFFNGYCGIPQKVRTTLVNVFFLENEKIFKHIRKLDYVMLDLNTNEGQQQLSEINRKVLAGGYEGIMIKNPEAPYECKRSKHWLKMKPFISCTLTVVGLAEGEGKYQGKLGALICEGQSDCGKRVLVQVGSGLTDQLREDYWTNQDQVIGSLVEIKADTFTQNENDKGSNNYSLRFPRFIGFREIEMGTGKI